MLSLVRIVLIILILFIFIYVITRLLEKRRIIMETNIEGMTSQDEVASLRSAAPRISISTLLNSRTKLPLREFCIKASYASAFSGNYVSSDMVKYVLSRGCRYLDIPVYYSTKDNIPCVAHIKDPAGIDMESENKVPLDTILNIIAANAFSSMDGGSGSPNPGDPLFIELRVYPDANNLIYDQIAYSITKNFSPKRYVDDTTKKAFMIDGNTIVDDLMGSAIFLMNKTIKPDYATASQDLANCINAELGGSTFRLQSYNQMQRQTKNPPILKDNFQKTNILVHNTIMPEVTESYSHPDIIKMVLDYGVQITAFSFYKRDDFLNRYEMLFNEYKSGFVPMSYAISYLSNMRSEMTGKKMAIGAFA